MEIIDKVVEVICDVYGISIEDYYSRNRKFPLPLARFTATTLLVRFYGMKSYSLSPILKRNHSTLNYHMKMHDNLMQTDKDYRHNFELIKESVSLPSFTITFKDTDEKYYAKSSRELQRLITTHMETTNSITIEITKC